jgi:hypothetical protein
MSDHPYNRQTGAGLSRNGLIQDYLVEAIVVLMPGAR